MIGPVPAHGLDARRTAVLRLDPGMRIAPIDAIREWQGGLAPLRG